MNGSHSNGLNRRELFALSVSAALVATLPVGVASASPPVSVRVTKTVLPGAVDANRLRWIAERRRQKGLLSQKVLHNETGITLIEEWSGSLANDGSAFRRLTI